MDRKEQLVEVNPDSVTEEGYQGLQDQTGIEEAAKKIFTSYDAEGDPFEADFLVNDHKMLCSISGRLDTITAPELMKDFDDNKTDDLEEITIDLEETEYISSAGLRVLLYMCRTLPDVSRLHIINYSQYIKQILELTGFKKLFGLDD